MKRIICTVTNDLNYDQRMTRICTSLAQAGFAVSLIGHKTPRSLPLQQRNFQQKRLNCFFSKGKLFYVEYNIRLFCFLWFQKFDIICAIDLDTILPCLMHSTIRRKERVYDAHELFCEMKEIVSRPFIYKCWKIIERNSVPKFRHGYTVNQPIADEFEKMYGVKYRVIRNIPVYEESMIPQKTEKYLLYQGAVNEGRSFETLIPAMRMVEGKLIICGDGNFMERAKELVRSLNLEHKIMFKGQVRPEDLKNITRSAWAGITLFDAAGKSNYMSLANRFFDYIHAGIPQLCVNYPVYRAINNKYDIAVLTDSLEAEVLAGHLNSLLTDIKLYERLQQNCLIARTELNWQQEEKLLLELYQNFID